MSEYFGYVTINVTRSPLRLYNISRIPLHPHPPLWQFISSQLTFVPLLYYVGDDCFPFSSP